jgi:hypothetical protein
VSLDPSHINININGAMAMHFSDAEDAVREWLRAHGGTVGGNQLGALYGRHDGLRDCIDGYGGAKRFCERSARLEFVPDGGSGQITADTQIDELEQELEDTQAQLRAALEAAATAEAERQLAEAEASRKRAKARAAEADAVAHAVAQAATGAAAAAAAEKEAAAAMVAKESEKARLALAAATAAEAKAAGLGIGAQVLFRLGGKHVSMRVVGYQGSHVEVEDSGTQKTYILRGETIAEAAKIQSQRRELQAKDPDIVTWECDVTGSWTPFSDVLTQVLEAAHASGAAASGVVAGVFKRAEHS